MASFPFQPTYFKGDVYLNVNRKRNFYVFGSILEFYDELQIKQFTFLLLVLLAISPL